MQRFDPAGPHVEINQLYYLLEDLSERSAALRGYL
jgi:hypothetical protein